MYRSGHGPEGRPPGQGPHRQAEDAPDEEETNRRGTTEPHGEERKEWRETRGSDETARRRLVEETARGSADSVDAVDEHRGESGQGRGERTATTTTDTADVAGPEGLFEGNVRTETDDWLQITGKDWLIKRRTSSRWATNRTE